MATQSQASIPLIEVKENSENIEFVLNPEAISMIEELSLPIKVIAAVGDARVGKSTALNFIHHTLSNTGTSKNAEEIFETGNTMEPVTHGVWIAKPNGEDGMKNVILLDVEGTDLGNDEVTDKLSIFTVLMSSKLMLFMKQSLSNHILDFLYKIVRLSKLALGEEKSEHFPRLTAVLLGALAAPRGYYGSFEEYIIDALISPNWKDESYEKRKAIGTRFPRENIAVFNLPYDPTLLETPQMSQVEGSKYLASIEKLKENIFHSDEKKSLEGGVLDGHSLVVLAKSLVKIMNDKDKWDNLNTNFYKLFEEGLCRRSYDKYIEPLVSNDKHTARYIEDQKDEKLRLFKENCKLEKWITKAEKDIDTAIRIRKERERQKCIEAAKCVAGGAVVGGAVVAGAVVAAGGVAVLASEAGPSAGAALARDGTSVGAALARAGVEITSVEFLASAGELVRYTFRNVLR